MFGHLPNENMASHPLRGWLGTMKKRFIVIAAQYGSPTDETCGCQWYIYENSVEAFGWPLQNGRQQKALSVAYDPTMALKQLYSPVHSAASTSALAAIIASGMAQRRQDWREQNWWSLTARQESPTAILQGK